VVIIVKTNTETGVWAHAILFSSELTQTYDQIIEYYTLRFAIEFVFRDAKQYWGLEDFMNVKETPVTNAANLAFCMVNIALILRRQMRPKPADFSVLDLKAHFRGLKYVAETLKLLPQMPDPIVIQQIAAKVALIGAVNAT
jgi:putative transposase